MFLGPLGSESYEGLSVMTESCIIVESIEFHRAAPLLSILVWATVILERGTSGFGCLDGYTVD